MLVDTIPVVIISIHALHGEGDSPSCGAVACAGLFQSTPSTGRATVSAYSITPYQTISIHALHGEGDPPIWCVVK